MACSFWKYTRSFEQCIALATDNERLAWKFTHRHNWNERQRLQIWITSFTKALMDGIANFDHLTQNFNTHWWSIFDLLVFWGKFVKKVIHNVPWKESMKLILREWRNLENYRILVNKDYLRDGLQVFREHHIICTLVQQTVMMHWSSVGTLLLACSITCLRNSKNKRTIPKIQLFQNVSKETTTS